MPDSSLFLQWLPALLQATRDHAIIVLDARGVIVEWLGAAPRLFGYAASEAQGQPIALIFTAADRERAMHLQELEVAIRDGRSEDERWQQRKDGSVLWASGVMEAVRRPDGELLGFCKILRDRTDLRAQIETLENRALAHAKELTRRNQFLTQIVHELRNPLGALLNAATLLERTDDRDKRQRYFELASRQVEVLDRLLRDMSELARVASDGIRINAERLSLQEALQMAVGGVEAAVEARQQELQLIVPPVAIEIEADPSRLQQMLLNLLGNAVKYSSTGGHITVTASVEGTHAVVRIEDDGVGIAPAMLARIFDLFTREERVGDIPRDGLGVGLAMVKELARLHHGTIEARSAGEDRGSLFVLRLPLEQPRLGA